MKVQHLISSLAASFHCLHIPVHELYFPIFGLTLGKISIFLLSLHFFIVIIWLNLVNTLAFYLKRFRRQRTLGYNEQIFCIKIRQQIWKVQLQRTPICYRQFFSCNILLVLILSSVHSISECCVFQESQREDAEDVTIDVYLMNGHKITTKILSTDQTDDVLEVRRKPAFSNTHVERHCYALLHQGFKMLRLKDATSSFCQLGFAFYTGWCKVAHTKHMFWHRVDIENFI